MLGTQLRVLGWVVPITSLPLNNANSPPLQSIVVKKLMEAISVSTDGIPTGCNAMSGMFLNLESLILLLWLDIDTYAFLWIVFITCNVKPDPTMTFYDAFLESKLQALKCVFWFNYQLNY